ncbi:hypothetical protein ABHF33_03365 [Chitinibacter sp. FCG-7]|uniref:Uncharacterized protein n=1 Tax=Chitinibacter mangrovi TaxID=3153927 RepID=A0AAU7FBV8_9NEIS
MTGTNAARSSKLQRNTGHRQAGLKTATWAKLRLYMPGKNAKSGIVPLLSIKYSTHVYE